MNTTFTTYAEKKAKQILNLLQGYTKGIRITAILILLLMGVSNAWAATWSFSGTSYMYFHNKAGWTDSNKMLFIGKDSWSSVYKMSVVSNTKLWVVQLPSSGWSDASYMAVAGAGGNLWGDGNWGPSNRTNATHYTNTYTSGITTKSTQYYLFTPASTSNNANISLDYLGNAIASLNKTITVKAKVSTDGGSSYAEATSPGTLSASSYKFTAYNSCASATSLSSGTITCGYTANTTLTAVAVTGYDFVGWYEGSTLVSSELSTTVNPTATTTYYAYYKAKQYTVSYGVCSTTRWGSIKLNSETAITTTGTKTLNYGTSISFTATPNAGYQVEGWYSNSGCTSKITAAGTSTIYNAGTLTANKTVYVKFEAIPANSHNITYTAEGTGWTYGNSNPTTAEEGATVTFVVNPTAGYSVSVSSDGPTLTGPNANNQYTFTMPTKDVKITVEAEPKQYTVTLNKQSGTGGSSSVTATYAAAMPTITPPTRTGYTFNGYFDATSGGTKYYNANGSSANNWDKTSNTTLYAQWTANKYTVKFNANDGTGSMSNQSHTYGVSKALTANAFTRKGYTFLGWSKTSSGEVQYTDQQTVQNLTANNNSTVNLYAVWQALPPTPVILKPNDEWKQANARYAIYYWGDGTDNNGWVELTDLGCSGEYFTGEVPASYLDFKFVRLNPNGKTDAAKNNGLHWDYKWNETGDLTTPAADKNLYDMTLKTHLYLDPGVWNVDDAWFAAYFFGNGETWKKMTDVDGLFACEIPTNYPNVIFVRKNPSNQELNFNDNWAQTGDLTIPTDGKNKFSISGWDNNGSWSAIDDNIHDNSKWTTYTVPTYTININAPEAGSIAVTVDGNTTTVSNTPKQITNIAAGTTFTIAYTPNAGFELGHSEVEGIKEAYDGAGTYTVCGPVDITAHFVTEEDQVVYLRPNDNWLADNALFYAYAFNRYGDDEWIELITEETDYTGAYGCTIPAGYSNVIFVRINPTAAEPSWNDDVKWNQSVDYVIPVNTTTNRFIIGEKITAEGADKDKYQGSWEASDRPIYGIPGDWQGTDAWSADEYPLMGPDGLVTVNITQTNDTLGFKVYRYPYGTDENSRKWLGNNGTMVRGGDAVHEGGWTMETNTDNCGLGVDVAGDYVFHFNIRESKLTVQYPPMPVPSTITLSAQRIFEDAQLNWIAGNGTEANPYQLYVDETARLTVTGLADVPGLTTCYRVGDNEEQTSNIIDFTNILTEDTAYTVYAYYKNATGATSDTVTVQTPYIKGLPMPFYLMTSPSQEINIDRIAAGENILVQFRSDAAATVGLYVKIGNGEEQKLTDIKNTISTDYPHDIDNNIDPCVLHYIARSTATVHGRTFEAKADVAIYKNVIIKVNDPEGWVKNAYMWRDGSGDVLTSWPGDPVLQNFGTWRVFSVKYPYYDRFIVNNGQTDGVVQTISWEVPDDDRCYELVAPEDYDHPAGEDDWKYGLKEADCPADLIVSDIENVTISVGEEKVIMPEIFVGLGHQLNDVTMDIETTDSESKYVRLLASGTNIILIGKAVGRFDVTVSYTLGGLTVKKTFEVEITSSNTLTITVKVPRQNGDGNFQIGWENTEDIKIYYEAYGLSTASIPMNYLGTFDDYYYMQAQVPFGNGPDIDFVVYWKDRGEWWKKSKKVENVTSDGCYVISQGKESDGARPITSEANGCKFYQVKVRMQNGKTYQSNIGFAATDILSFFAPGANEVGRNAGAVIVYENNKAVKLIEPGKFETSDVYTASVNEDDYTLTNVAPYTGNFYIRTWGTDGDISNKGWNSVQDWDDSEKASRTFTEFVSREGEFYNHYWVQAMNSGGYDGKDVSACVANDYNDDLAGKLLQDKNTTETGDIKLGGTGKTINVRFGYDPRTNYFGRAVLQGSADASYLNLHCDNAYADKECKEKLPYGNHTNNDDNKFRDVSNWVYERDVYVNITNGTPSASLYVEARSPHVGEDGKAVVYNHLLGYVTNEITGEESTTPIQKTVIGSGTDNGVYKVRVVYDFKTNRIIAVWEIATDLTITTGQTVNADILFIRKENEDVPQITLSGNGEINNLKSLFFAMELDRGRTNKDERHEEQYMFTLPFDCVVGSISGLHGYMELWGIQRYRGDLRAQKGWYAETATFWEWLTPKDILRAGEGYLLAFDKKNAPWKEIEVDKLDANGNIIEGQKDTISMIRLYFPSIGSGFDLQQQSAEQLTRTYENHTCTLKLHNRYLQDSNWKMIGTTSYNNATVKEYEKDNDPEYDELNKAPRFRYKYSYTFDNNNNRTSYNYDPELGSGDDVVYQSFYGYMVQFAGTITWSPINETVPEPLAAPRRAQAVRSSVTMRLELANTDGEKQDQTFVALDENGTTTFDQNKDLNKVFNSGKPNIYTLSEGIPFAGNTLPMAEVIVPVGVKIDAEGEYTFRMPDGTEGMVVELIDYERDITTNLLLFDYTVTLPAGSNESRFALHIQPNKSGVTTGVEEAYPQPLPKGKGAKFLIDGKLIIRTAEGVVYDAQGHRL